MINSIKVLLLIPAIAVAQSPWTDYQHGELVQLQNACEDIATAYSHALEIELAARDAYSLGAQHLVAGLESCLMASMTAYGVEDTRLPHLVAQAIGALESAKFWLPSGAREHKIDSAIAALQGFDADAGYGAEPETAPLTIPSHGDYRRALLDMAEFQVAVIPSLAAAARVVHTIMTPELPQAAAAKIRQSALIMSKVVKASINSMALTAFVVSPKNARLIATDNAATGGLRGDDFFRAVLALEYATGGGAVERMFSGRPKANPTIPLIFSASQQWDRLNRTGSADLGEANGDDWLLQQMTNGELRMFRDAVFDAWQHSDNYAHSMMGFFHPNPIPADVIPPPHDETGPLMPEASWTPAEYDSLVRLVRALELLADATVQAMAQREFSSAQGLAYGGENIVSGLSAIVGAPNRSDETRDLTVAGALRAIDNGRHKVANAIPASGDARAMALQALGLIDGFDRSLSYMDYQHDGWPAIIGPHGDYDSAQRRLAHATRYQYHVLWDVARLAELTPMLPEQELAELVEVQRLMAEATRAVVRALGIEAFVITPGDWEIILADYHALSGLRPPSFFRTMLALEYAFGNPDETPMNVGGRAPVSTGYTNAAAEGIQRLLDLAPRLAELNGGSSWMAERMSRDGIIIGATRNLGLLAETYQDALDLWPGVTQYGWGVLVFAHVTPMPPDTTTPMPPDTTTHSPRWLRLRGLSP